MTTEWTARALDQSGPIERAKDLMKIRLGDLLPSSNLLALNWTLPGASCKLKQRSDPVVGAT
jgi:hypothetical protein